MLYPDSLELKYSLVSLSLWSSACNNSPQTNPWVIESQGKQGLLPKAFQSSWENQINWFETTVNDTE